MGGGRRSVRGTTAGRHHPGGPAQPRGGGAHRAERARPWHVCWARGLGRRGARRHRARRCGGGGSARARARRVGVRALLRRGGRGACRRDARDTSRSG
eukprot:3842389-Prymnesium_polylepis.1